MEFSTWLGPVIGILIGVVVATLPIASCIPDGVDQEEPEQPNKLDIWVFAHAAKVTKDHCEKSLPRDQYCTIRFTATKPEVEK
jgi:hypothetical protein